MGCRSRSSRTGNPGPPKRARVIRQYPPCVLRLRLARRVQPVEGGDRKRSRFHRRTRAHRRLVLWETARARHVETKWVYCRGRRMGYYDIQCWGSAADHTGCRADCVDGEPTLTDPLDRQGQCTGQFKIVEEDRYRDAGGGVSQHTAGPPSRRFGCDAYGGQPEKAQRGNFDREYVRGHVRPSGTRPWHD